ncbi:alpha/beta fold hydrolase [Glycomyces rhizosphaerae]|uniref:Alpha/beta fold hydrolase n=1 Tax=Glycomyces rhizosphaerae TaxID=2054422 RepID=A0ABV7Q8V3_9ACTN
MLSWPDSLCQALARGGRHVVRYDLRDSGESTTVDPEAPAYTLRDLAADAAALARELDDRPAHLAGIGVGGMVAQVAALDHPKAFSALTLAGTRPVAPGPVQGPARPRRRDDGPTVRAPDARLVRPHRCSPVRRCRGGDPRRRPRRGTREGRTHFRPHSEHGARGPDGQSVGHGLRQTRLPTALARAPARACDADTGGARSSQPVLPGRERRGARARDPRRSAAGARTGRDSHP